ncbi:MAG: PIG-L family deacetylase [Candidatus Limnocylindrales bacterium]
MSVIRRDLKRPIYWLVEHAWLAALAAVGLVMRPSITRFEMTGRDRVLAFVTHPDDEIFGCAAALAAHAAAGDQVLLVAVTDGRASGALGLAPDAMAAVRATEFEAAARALGVRGSHYRLPEGDWSDVALERLVLAEVDSFKPDIVYAPSPVDHHIEHLRVAAVVGRVCAQTALREVRACQVEVPLTPVLANLSVARTGGVVGRVAAAEAAYASQSLSLARARRVLAQAGALWRAGQPLEVFWSMSPAAYASVTSTVGSGLQFRGVRDRPFTDGLAWIVGLRERRRLVRVAERSQRSSIT